MREPLRMWTVYERPKDYPEGYIARMWLIDGPEPVATVISLIDTLERIREYMQRQGLVCIPRSPNDEAQILEVWL